jgi:hypothetical protein
MTSRRVLCSRLRDGWPGSLNLGSRFFFLTALWPKRRPGSSSAPTSRPVRSIDRHSKANPLADPRAADLMQRRNDWGLRADLLEGRASSALSTQTQQGNRCQDRPEVPIPGCFPAFSDASPGTHLVPSGDRRCSWTTSVRTNLVQTPSAPSGCASQVLVARRCSRSGPDSERFGASPGPPLAGKSVAGRRSMSDHKSFFGNEYEALARDSPV